MRPAVLEAPGVGHIAVQAQADGPHTKIGIEIS